MKLGVYLNAQHPAGDDPARRFAETVEQVRLIRSLGFDSIWGGEHHATPGFHYFPLLPMLQRLAAEADGLWMGTNLVLLPLHNPVEIAEIGAFLDVITGGRFLLGVGLGYRPEEFAVFGVPMAERVSRLVEGVEIIRRLWTEDRSPIAGGTGPRERDDPPRPVQRPRPPILVGSQVPAGIARAARIADGWLVVPVPTVDEFAAQAAAFTAPGPRRAAAEPQICRLLEVSARPTRTTAIRRAAPYLLDEVRGLSVLGLPGRHARSGRRARGPAPPARRQSVRDRLTRPGDRGAARPAPGRRHPCHDARELARHAAGGRARGIELLGREVLPEVRRRAAVK